MVVVTIMGSLSAILFWGRCTSARGRDAHLYGGEDVIDIGLGMRPVLTGEANGARIFQAGIAFAVKEFNPQTLRLSVATFNTRAITLYKT